MTRLRGGAVAAAVVVAVSVAGCKSDPIGGAPGPVEKAHGGAALSAADSLTVKGRAPKTGYSRERFGSAWADTDSNSCDTRVISMVQRLAAAFSQLMRGVARYA